jgi:hypothetical protein
LAFLAKSIKEYRRLHRTRLLDYDLSPAYLINMWNSQNGLCAATGMEMIHRIRSPYSASVDRIDNNKGYVRGNVRLVCHWANLARGRHSVEVFNEVLLKLRLVFRREESNPISV